MVKEARDGKYQIYLFDSVAISTCAGPLLSIFVFDPENNKQLWEALTEVATCCSVNPPVIHKAWHSYSIECTITPKEQ